MNAAVFSFGFDLQVAAAVEALKRTMPA